MYQHVKERTTPKHTGNDKAHLWLSGCKMQYKNLVLLSYAHHISALPGGAALLKNFNRCRCLITENKCIKL